MEIEMEGKWDVRREGEETKKEGGREWVEGLKGKQ